jgi:hypothetical protein
LASLIAPAWISPKKQNASAPPQSRGDRSNIPDKALSFDTGSDLRGGQGNTERPRGSTAFSLPSERSAGSIESKDFPVRNGSCRPPAGQAAQSRQPKCRLVTAAAGQL